MSTDNSASVYHRSTAFGATAIGQVIALYDTILRDFRQAIAAIEAGQIEQRVNCTNHALLVIGELHSVLDFEKGGEAARYLSNFYHVTRAMATEASIKSSREKFQELISMFARLRAAWTQAEKMVGPREAPDRPRNGAQSQPTYTKPVPQPPAGAEHSGNGGWKA